MLSQIIQSYPNNCDVHETKNQLLTNGLLGMLEQVLASTQQ